LVRQYYTKKQNETTNALRKAVARWNKAKLNFDKAQAAYEKAQRNYKIAHGKFIVTPKLRRK
jgi:hypothetical protein